MRVTASERRAITIVARAICTRVFLPLDTRNSKQNGPFEQAVETGVRRRRNHLFVYQGNSVIRADQRLTGHSAR